MLETALTELCDKLNGVQGAVIVSIEGFVVAAYEPPRERASGDDGATSSPQVAAMAATLIALGERTLGRLSQGELTRLMLEGSSGAMLVVPASNRAALALMVENSAKMGLSLFALKKAAVEISAILEGEA
jgi:predicted regulator of Ras-like GTPase activity (Roadblock/LC7/MglB family)